MDIEIRKLTPDLAEDYVRFFDATSHNDEYGVKCYCVSWRSDISYAGDGNHWYPTEEERREKALQFIRDGHIQGYLAYHGDKIVGWCNASADCQGGLAHLRSEWPIDEICADMKVKSVFCFVIAPEMQRKGVASQLLKRVCEDAAAEGFDFVEAYTNKKFVNDGFRGPLALYEKCGFSTCAKRSGKIVVRKALK